MESKGYLYNSRTPEHLWFVHKDFHRSRKPEGQVSPRPAWPCPCLVPGALCGPCASCPCVPAHHHQARGWGLGVLVCLDVGSRRARWALCARGLGPLCARVLGLVWSGGAAPKTVEVSGVVGVLLG